MNSAYLRYQVGGLLNRTLPLALCMRLAERFADLHYRRSSIDRVAVQANLAMVMGHPVLEDAAVVREVFRSFARYLVEFFNAHRYHQWPVSVEGNDRVAAVMRARRGGIALSAHLGNWELGAIALHHLGYPVTAVALPHRDPRINALFDRQRQRCGVEVLPLGVEAMQRCLEAVRRGHIVGLVGDREFGTNGIAVSFCGQHVVMPRGPALLSLRTGAPVIPAFLIREGRWRFRFYLDAPIWPPQEPAAIASQVHSLTQRYTDVIARYIQRFPTQWVMLQPLAAASPRLQQEVDDPRTGFITPREPRCARHAAASKERRR